jgi:hypothetical protein
LDLLDNHPNVQGLLTVLSLLGMIICYMLILFSHVTTIGALKETKRVSDREEIVENFENQRWRIGLAGITCGLLFFQLLIHSAVTPK